MKNAGQANLSQAGDKGLNNLQPARGQICLSHSVFQQDSRVHGDVSIGFVEEYEIYSAVGEDGFRRLVAAFYRQVPGDDILGPIYPREDLPGAEERLRDFLIYRFGGPQRYIENRGHPRLRMRHAPFPVDAAARDRWLLLMDRALKETNLSAEAEAQLRVYFESTAHAMMNRL